MASLKLRSTANYMFFLRQAMLICSNVCISIFMNFSSFHKVYNSDLNLIKNIYGDAWLVTNVKLYDLVILTVVIVQDVLSKNDILRSTS